MGYDYEIQYKKGSENVAADAISRVQGVSLFQLTLISFQPLFLERIKNSWTTDLEVQKQISDLQLQQGQSSTHFTWQDELFRRKNKLVVGQDSILRKDILKECHSTAMGGHSGVHPTHQRLKSMFY
ncbi:uncharacterized protein LOC143603488 [Bidens hawaiensis]|uniref:uncharacterized protein LOC143603488 n=1 Tax=Bidens hawaiensis TaxID=980011 RepID=UPI00404B50FF